MPRYPSAPPPTAVSDKPLRDRWEKVGKKPTPAAEAEYWDWANPLAPIKSDTAPGRWGYDPQLTIKTLWNEFGGKEFVWTENGKKIFRAKASLAASDAKGVRAQVFEQQEEQQSNIWPLLHDDLKTFLTKPLGAVKSEMRGFMADVGFSVPLLQTIKSAIMMAYSTYQAADAAWDRHNVNNLAKDMAAIHANAKEMPIFDLGKNGLVGKLSQKMDYALVDLGGYTFDLVAGAVPTGAAQATSVARLLVKLRRLYETWKATQEINKVLGAKELVDLHALVKKHNLLGCHIFQINKFVLTNRFTFSDMTNLSLSQRQEVLQVLGVDRDVLKQEAQCLDKLRWKAEQLIAEAPYKLLDSASKKTSLGSGKKPGKAF